MLRMASKWIMMSIMLLALAGTAFAAPVQQGALLAAIVSFSADTALVNYADVEAGTVQVTFSWQTMNTNGQYRLALEAYQGNQWVSVTPENEALPLNGSRQVTVALPQNFGVPTYRLTLKTSQGEVIGQQFITLPYAPVVQALPSIVSFTTPSPSIDTNLLVQSNARLMVSWEVSGSSPNTLIRFEQVLPDGTTISAEPARSTLWLPPSGEGAIIPRSTASKADLHFRMSLINLSDGSVVDQAEFSIPVIGQVVIAPATIQQTSSGTINAFSAQPAPAQGGSVIVNWDAANAASVQLLQQVGDEGPTTLYIELPTTGSMTVPIPENSPGATFTLRAQNAEGEVSTGEVVVTPAGEGQ